MEKLCNECISCMVMCIVIEEIGVLCLCHLNSADGAFKGVIMQRSTRGQCLTAVNEDSFTSEKVAF